MASLFMRLATIAALQMSLPAAAQVAPSPAPARFPDVENDRLLALAGLGPIARYGDVLRYDVETEIGYGQNVATAILVQVHATYDAEPPRVLHVEFEMPSGGGGWRVVRRREAQMHPLAFDALVRNAVAAASVVGSRARRGTVMRCSHAATSRLDIRVPGEDLAMSRTAHCSEDAPATVAGNLLIASAEQALAAGPKGAEAPAAAPR